MEIRDGKPAFITNNAGGILGGISSGEVIVMKAAFKPTPSISRAQKTITAENREETIEIEGRHDPCVGPRAVAVVEAMAAITVMDAYLKMRAYGK